jgi:ABC-2 type transport system ATP-binding protein
MAEQSNLAIVAKGLTRRFGAFTAVKQVDLEVGHGEVFGLLGANGAGKTTVIRMLCGTLTPSSGEICVADTDMVRLARMARGRIGYVTQRFALYGDLTVVENLKLQGGLYNLRGERVQQRIGWALDRLDLKTEQDTRAGDLPLGFQRRLAVAAALLHEPDVLFLDEPTSGIDPLARQQFWELVYELAEGGIGVLVTTHYMDEALFCDRLALMDAGRIVVDGTPEELLTRNLATPILEVRTSASGDCMRWLAQWPEIREVIPYAGRLRVRLHAGVPAAEFIAKIRQDALQAGLPVDAVDIAAPTLEDVFVAVLEEQAAA